LTEYIVFTGIRKLMPDSFPSSLSHRRSPDGKRPFDFHCYQPSAADNISSAPIPFLIHATASPKLDPITLNSATILHLMTSCLWILTPLVLLGISPASTNCLIWSQCQAVWNEKLVFAEKGGGNSSSLSATTHDRTKEGKYPDGRTGLIACPPAQLSDPPILRLSFHGSRVLSMQKNGGKLMGTAIDESLSPCKPSATYATARLASVLFRKRCRLHPPCRVHHEQPQDRYKLDKLCPYITRPGVSKKKVFNNELTISVPYQHK